MTANISRILASEAGLSTTTTSSGLFEEARTSPPGAILRGDADAIDSHEIANFLAGKKLVLRLHRRESFHHLRAAAPLSTMIASRCGAIRRPICASFSIPKSVSFAHDEIARPRC